MAKITSAEIHEKITAYHSSLQKELGVSIYITWGYNNCDTEMDKFRTIALQIKSIVEDYYNITELNINPPKSETNKSTGRVIKVQARRMFIFLMDYLKDCKVIIFENWNLVEYCLSGKGDVSMIPYYRYSMREYVRYDSGVEKTIKSLIDKIDLIFNIQK